MKQQAFILHNKGMNRDLSISKIGESNAFENRNIRIQAVDNDTLLSVTNERGNRLIEDVYVNGELLGYCVLNNYLVLFTVDEKKKINFIYRVKYNNSSFQSMLLFSGELNMDLKHPIEALSSYETDDIQKVYWIDGKNVLRFINISDTYLKKHLLLGSSLDDKEPIFSFRQDTTWFDSTRGANSFPEMVITKDGSGVNRPNGVAQYFLTYYNKNGQQTGIISSSSLVYLSPEGKGGSADDHNSNRVIIDVKAVDNGFDYARLYEIERSSQGGQSVAYIVGDIRLTGESATFIDAGVSKTSIDISSLLFLGSNGVIANTMTQKDGTLFLGNLLSIGNKTTSNIETAIKKYAFKLSEESFTYGKTWESIIVEFQYSSNKIAGNIPYVYSDGYYPYENQLKYTSSQITTFKGGEKYRFALRFINSNGSTTKSFWIGDKVNPLYPKILSDGTIQRAVAICKIPYEIVNECGDFAGVQLMIAKATYSDRSVLAQGLVSPTVFNLYDRYLGRGYAQSSWIYRPKGGGYTFKHFMPIKNSSNLFSELQCNYWKKGASPLPFYYKKGNKIVNKPEGLESERAISIKVVVSAQKIITKYWGYIEINFYNDIKSEEPTRTFARQIGNESSYYASKLALIRDWMQAYKDASVPLQYRIDETEMGEYCEQALDNATVDINFLFPIPFGKPGTSVYNLSKRLMTLQGTVVDYSFSEFNKQYYFVDENIVTLNSPEFDYNAVSVDKNTSAKFRIVGVAKLTGNISDYTIETTNGKLPGNRNVDFNFSTPNITNDVEGLSAFPLYLEHGTKLDSDNITYKPETSVRSYMMYMWHKVGSIPMLKDNDVLVSELKSKRFANLHYSYFSIYNNYERDKEQWSVKPTSIRHVNIAGAPLYDIKVSNESRQYLSDINTIVTMPGSVKYPVYSTSSLVQKKDALVLDEEKDGKCKSDSPVHIAYKSNSHVVITLPKEYGSDIVLPYLFTDEKISFPAVDRDDISKPIIPWGSKDDLDSALLIFTDKESVGLNGTSTSGLFKPFVVVRRMSDNKKYIMSDDNTINDKLAYILSNSVDGFDYYVPTSDINNSLRLIPFDKINAFGSDQDVSISFKVKVNKVKENNDKDWNIAIIEVNTQVPIDNIRFMLNPNNTDWYECVQEVNHVSDEKIVVINKLLTRSDYSLFDSISKLQIKYNIKFKNNEDTFINDKGEVFKLVNDIDFQNSKIFDINIDKTTEETFYCDVDTKYSAYAPLDDFIDPTTNTKNIIFRNIEPNAEGTDIEYIKLDIFHKFSAIGLAGAYKFPLQSKYELKSKNISSGDKYIFIGELYIDYDSAEEDVRYGGIHESALLNNIFIPAGDIVTIDKKLKPNSSQSIIGNRGDTYFQRWDSLKTIPTDDKDDNQVVEIVSAMVESHINLDGRTDINRGATKLASIDLNKFGLINRAYSQADDFRTSRVLDESNNIDSYPSTITWSLQKSSNADIDEWTRTSLASMLSLDGDKGSLRALRRFNNSIIAFQDTGISEILFNTRTQLSTNAGVPVEIANSGKVEGKRYISDKYGSVNKLSIIQGKAGIYFLDNINKAFCSFTGNGIENISDKFGFGAWFRSYLGINDISKGISYGSVPVSFYDKIHSDIYLTFPQCNNDPPCLVFSEKLGVFTSFYDYYNTPMMVNIGNRFISFKSGRLWLQNEGYYCNFFGEQYNYSVTYRCSPNPYEDKIWTNLDYRSDAYEILNDEGLLDNKWNDRLLIDGGETSDGLYFYRSNETFNNIEIWNEYQQTGNIARNPIKKFRTWRLAIPRAIKTKTNKYGLDRIRNPWINIKFEKNLKDDKSKNSQLMQLHDVIVKYFE